MKNDMLFLLAFMLFIAIILATVLVNDEDRHKPIKCYSAHDIFVYYNYDILDDNTTVITSNGRVYNLEECEEL